jgi:hypothetical protein
VLYVVAKRSSVLPLVNSLASGPSRHCFLICFALPSSSGINTIRVVKNRRPFKTLFALAFILISAAHLFARTSRYSSSSSSSPALTCGIYIALAVFFAGLIALILYADKRRSNKIQAIATRLGYTFRRKPTDADNSLIAGCNIANAGHSRSTSNILEAAQSAELKITLFEYAYTIGYGKSSQRYNQTVTRMQSTVFHLPAFILYPETIFSKLGKLFGGADINFSEAPAFSKKYILRGPDEAAIRALFTPTVLQFFEQRKALTIDSAGDTLFLHRANRRIKPEELESHIAEAKNVLALFFEAQNSQPSIAPPPMPPPLPA